MPKAQKKSTYERILDKSTQLFNRHGVFQVSVQRISDELELRSVGNITYYFKKKNDIIHTIIDRLENELLSLIESAPTLLKKDMNARDHADYLASVQLILWKYRFVFNNIAHLSAEDKNFGARFAELEKHVLNSLEESSIVTTELGWMLPVAPPNSVRLIMENIWNIWLRNLSASQIKIPGNTATRDKTIYQSVLHHYSLMAPHLSPQVRDGMYEYLQTKYSKKK